MQWLVINLRSHNISLHIVNRSLVYSYNKHLEYVVNIIVNHWLRWGSIDWLVVFWGYASGTKLYSTWERTISYSLTRLKSNSCSKKLQYPEKNIHFQLSNRCSFCYEKISNQIIPQQHCGWNEIFFFSNIEWLQFLIRLKWNLAS